MRYCSACENIISNPKLLRCLCTYCESCVQSLRIDDKVICLVYKQESTFREEDVDDYTYNHSLILHDKLMDFDQPTFELAHDTLKSLESLYPKGSCANCSSSRKNRKTIITSFSNAMTLQQRFTVPNLAEWHMYNILRTVFR